MKQQHKTISQYQGTETKKFVDTKPDSITSETI